MLTVFANIKIDHEDRLQHFKDSFLSFSSVGEEWLVNIRGGLRAEAILFLQDRLGERVRVCELLDDTRGWIQNALEILSCAHHPYVLLWVEDHLLVDTPEVLQKIIHEMAEENVDILPYSWWQNGRSRIFLDAFVDTHKAHSDVLHLTPSRWKQIIASGHPYYLISLCSVFKKDFLIQLLCGDRYKLPLWWSNQVYRVLTLLQTLGAPLNQRRWFHRINQMTGNFLRRFPKEAPFDLEKGPWRTDVLPLCMAIPKRELFSSIDDDLDEYGTCLIHRGVYKNTGSTYKIGKHQHFLNSKDS